MDVEQVGVLEFESNARQFGFENRACSCWALFNQSEGTDRDPSQHWYPPEIRAVKNVNARFFQKEKNTRKRAFF
jgi:hypothetical protein